MPDLPAGLFRTLDRCIDAVREITGQMQRLARVEAGSHVTAINEREDGCGSCSSSASSMGAC